jgi:membrane peptidoglycan carboxypeptidase
LKIVDFQGNVIYEYEPPEGEQVIRQEHAFLISSILSDNNARSWMFGSNSVLNLPFQVAAKTGTTNDFRDNWTMGYTPDLVTGVWVGNADYTPMVNTTGLSGAAPIWSQFMQYAVPYVTNNNPTPFTIPAGITEKIVCNLSGTEPSQWCRGGQRSEFFASDQLPPPRSQDLLTKTTIDTWTGLIAGDACEDFAKEEQVMNVPDQWARQWFKTGDGRAWLESHDFPRNPYYKPERECSLDDPRPLIQFTNLNETDTITSSPLKIKGIINVTKGDFTGWRLEYGVGEDPSEWTVLAEGRNKFEQADTIYDWDVTDVDPKRVTLQIYLMNGENYYAEKRVFLTFNLPTPTPEPTLTPTVTMTLAPPTIAPTDTSIPVVPTDTPTNTLPAPSLTPTPTTPPPTATPTMATP